MRRGATLLECFIAIAVLASLAALLFPVVGQAKLRGYMSSTLSNLHQVGLSLSLYRSDAGGEGVYGDAYLMGLPANPSLLKPYGFDLQKTEFWPPGSDRDRRTLLRRYAMPSEDIGRPYPWSRYAEDERDESISYASMAFTDVGQPLRSPFGIYRGLGVRLDTGVMTRVRSGNWDDYQWWE